MRLLLDTHIWIWVVSEKRRLSRDILRELDSPRNEVYLSPISIWEAGWSERRGRWIARPDFATWLRTALTERPLLEATFTSEVGEEAAAIELPQPDAGDTFLAATARVYGLTLITTDPQLLASSWHRTMPNE
jgi:PIN domain nuclease of toxin-antitoxin system